VFWSSICASADSAERVGRSSRHVGPKFASSFHYLQKLMYRCTDNFRPVSLTVSAIEWVHAMKLSRLQRKTGEREREREREGDRNKQTARGRNSALTTVILLPQRLSCYWGKIMSLRMLTNLRLADLILTAEQQRTTGQNLPSDQSVTTRKEIVIGHLKDVILRMRLKRMSTQRKWILVSSGIQGCSAVQSDINSSTFRRKELPPSLWYKRKRSKHKTYIIEKNTVNNTAQHKRQSQNWIYSSLNSTSVLMDSLHDWFVPEPKRKKTTRRRLVTACKGSTTAL
jgi:hypothetical protein